MTNRSMLVGRAEREAGLPCSEALARQYEGDGILNPDDNDDEYLARLVLVLRGRSAGQSKTEIRKALGLFRETTLRLGDEEGKTATEILETLADQIQTERGLPRTKAIMFAMSERRDLWERYRAEQRRAGTALARQEGLQ